MNEKHIKEVFSDEAFVSSLLELDTPVEVQAALKAKDIDLTEDEVIAIRDGIIEQVQKLSDGDALSMEQLDEAAGGTPFVVVGTVGFIVTAIVGTGILAGGIGVIGGGITAGVLGLGSLISNRRW